MTLWYMAIITINIKPLLAWLSQSSLYQGDFIKWIYTKALKVPHHCQ